MTALPSGIPADARDLVTSLLAEELRPVDALRSELDAHLDAIKAAQASNEYVDVSLALRLTDVSRALLDEAEAKDTDDARRLAQAAVRYFILDEDGENDLTSVHGLVDDAEVCNAVARALGRGDLVTGT